MVFRAGITISEAECHIVAAEYNETPGTPGGVGQPFLSQHAGIREQTIAIDSHGHPCSGRPLAQPIEKKFGRSMRHRVVPQSNNVRSFFLRSAVSACSSRRIT